MFASIYGRTIPKCEFQGDAGQVLLVDLAFTFSPLVEQTTVDTVVLDVAGQDLLFGSAANPGSVDNSGEIDSLRALASEIVRRATQLGFPVNVSVAANPDAAIHSARSFKGVIVIPAGRESLQLGNLPLKMLDYSLADIEKERVEEISETLELWGLRTFSDFAQLPLAGVAQRLGQAGVRLQKLAQGKSDRQMVLVQPPLGFEQTLELEHPVEELEPLSFILSRLLNQLCANLHSHALATNELRLRLKLENKTEHERTITLPVPMRNPKTLLRLLLFEIEAQPPLAAVISVTIVAEPEKPRIAQTGLFIPLAPEPEKLELTLARLAKLVGADKVGSPEILDAHRPDAFRMKRFSISTRNKSRRNQPSAIVKRQCVMGFRVFRPPWHAEVQTIHGRPMRISAHDVKSSCLVRGKVICASGPWRTSGDWWRPDVWARDEWDIAVADSISKQSDVLCRIYRDVQSDEWFVEGIYD
ncbi:MAG TPA: DNA polymerase Y family protein [Pyrinomonadaceae bacterium]|nr:DNA polymerase Y family protein [Pyrinomonadaceae bacterium]